MLLQRKVESPVIAPFVYQEDTEQVSMDEIVRVLDRAARDNDFVAQLTHFGSDALQDYALTNEAKVALLSGDIRWVESRVGKLDARLSTWLECRLQQEAW